MLVAGAQGYVGAALLPELAQRGFEVRAMGTSRRAYSIARLGMHVEFVRGSPHDAALLDEAVNGIDVACYLFHAEEPNPGSGAADHARRFSSACLEAGVGKIMTLRPLADRWAGDAAPGAALRHGGVPVTELRSGPVIGPGSVAFEAIHGLARRLPVLPAPRWMRTTFEPIAISDLVRCLAGVLDEPRATGEVLEVGCGEAVSFAELVTMCAAELDRTIQPVAVPADAPALSAYILHLLTNVDMHVARPLIDSLQHHVAREDIRINGWLPADPHGPREALQHALAARRGGDERQPHWTDAPRPTRIGRVREVAARTSAASQQTHPRVFRDYRTFDADLAPDELYARVESVGGRNGYGAGVDALWKLRGAIDRLAGGPGLRRGRPAGRELHDGDAVDVWRVAVARPPRRLALVAEMLVPGTARLDFAVEPLPGGGSRLHQLATLTRESPWSDAYWYAVAPAHGWVFEELGRHILQAPRAASDEPLADARSPAGGWPAGPH